jgi:glycosyltransferase involved in cell wall biosynthesis
MRVALVLPTLEVGGQERLAVALAAVLPGLQVTPEVVALMGGGPLQRDLEEANVPYEVLHPRRTVPGYPAALLARLRKNRPDVLHSHSGSWFPTAVAGELLGIPVLHAEHGRYPDEPWWTPWADRLAARCTSRIVVVSELLQREMQARLRSVHPPAVVQNGVTAPPLLEARARDAVRGGLAVPAGALIVGTVGRLVEVKAHGLLLRAMTRVVREVPNAHCVIVGDGPLRQVLAAAADSADLRGRVHLTGSRPDAAELAACFDVYVSSSSTEGTPLAVLEAMAAAVPIVATDVGGLRAALGDGRAGMLVEAGDETALAGAIATLLRRGDLGAELGRAARARVEQEYSLAACARRYVTLYRELDIRSRERHRH